MGEEHGQGAPEAGGGPFAALGGNGTRGPGRAMQSKSEGVPVLQVADLEPPLGATAWNLESPHRRSRGIRHRAGNALSRARGNGVLTMSLGPTHLRSLGSEALRPNTLLEHKSCGFVFIVRFSMRVQPQPELVRCQWLGCCPPRRPVHQPF